VTLHENNKDNRGGHEEGTDCCSWGCQLGMGQVEQERKREREKRRRDKMSSTNTES
jgi:hypothetical protein